VGCDVTKTGSQAQEANAVHMLADMLYQALYTYTMGYVPHPARTGVLTEALELVGLAAWSPVWPRISAVACSVAHGIVACEQPTALAY
jgi:hypothetical protein